MNYSIDKIRYDYNKGNKADCLFFWGHQPSSKGIITKTCFSQWWKSDFRVDIDNYCCIEKYMMAEKARIFEDKEIFESI